MTSVNPINVNTQGIGSSYGFGSKPKTSSNEAEEAAVGSQAEQTQVPADYMLALMAQQAYPININKIDPSKYVNSESAARIADFIQGFEDKVAEGLAAFDAEFKDINISDSAKMATVLTGINQEAENI